MTSCYMCGKELKRSPSKLKRNKRNFCSHQCYWTFLKTLEHKTRRVRWICGECGKSFEVRPSLAKRHKHHFCSWACYRKFRSETFVGSNHGQWKGLTAICKECGKRFHTTPSRLKDKRGIFCSNECKNRQLSHAIWNTVGKRGKNNPSWKGGKIQLFCRNCGTPIERNKSGLNHKNLHFCSIECRFQHMSGSNHPNWKGGNYQEYYGPNWHPQRRKARKRDNYTCKLCGITEKELGQELDIHHIIPFREFGILKYKRANRLENLVSVCHSCHFKLEQNAGMLKVKTNGTISTLDV